MMLEAEVKEAPALEASAVHMSSTAQQVQGAVPSPVAAAISATEDEDESEDESEILEESPCGRWQKRREEVLLVKCDGQDANYHKWMETGIHPTY